MAFTQILAVQNRTNAAQSSQPVALHGNPSKWSLRVDLATPNDFTDPAQTLNLGIQWSFDNGTTWIDWGTVPFQGSPTNTWGRTSPNPLMSGPVPAGATDVRGNYVQNGTFSFGISIEES